VRPGSNNGECYEADIYGKDSEGRGHRKEEQVVQVIQKMVVGSTKHESVQKLPSC
jgi:hypothetical protein